MSKGAYMYQVLARKYRPRNFNELVGQNHVSRALTSALERGRLHHAYLFTGTRGVGKTTIARILAKCLNCETGVTSTPCEVCATCTAVNEGRFIDLIEIDAASRTKVEDTRELLDNVPYAPTQGRFKVYLIDEVHMLSTHSFNALLKTLEEPPEHVKFLFATTDPQKLPITVISRCLQFTLRPLAVDEITTHLTTILEKESISAEQDAIWQIAESAQGSVRDALSLTDQAIAYGQGAIHHQDVKETQGQSDRTIIYDLMTAIHQNQKGRISELLLQFRQQALDVSLVLDQLVSTLHELAMLQYLPDLSLKYSAEINAKIMQLSKLISAQDLQLYYQIACKGRSDLQISVTQEQGFEMCVLRLLAFRPMQPNERLVSSVETTVATQPPALQAIAQKETAQDVVTTPVVQPQPEITESLDESYYSDEDDAHIATSQDEPSSDDFLDEPEVDAVSPSNTHIQPTQHTDQIIFDASSDGALFDLDESEDPKNIVPSSNEASRDDFLLFEEIAPLDDVSLQVQTKSSQSQLEELSIAPVQTVSVQDLQQEESLVADLVPTVPTSVEIAQTASTLMPQDILKLQQQQLEGEWTVDKWEYWFRSSELPPALQELAQHGLMTGEIDGVCTFHIPKQYERLVTQMQHLLEQVVYAQWPSTHFDVQYEELEQLTPYALQHARKGKAHQRAAELLHNEPVIKSLLSAFDGTLENIQLK